MSASPADQELLQRDVDDETSPEERTALHQRLRADPALRAEHEALLDLRRRLDGVGLVDPPPGLVSDVLRSVRQAVGRGPGSRAAWLAPLLARRPALALAATLAVGIGAGVLLAGLLGPGWPAIDESQVAGTILSPGPADPAVVDRVRLEGAGLRAEAVARMASGVAVADLVIEPPRTVEVFVETAGSGLRPRGFEAVDGLAAAGAIVEAGGVYVADAPPGRYRVALAATAAGSGEIRIRLQSPDGRVDGTLRLGPVSAPGPAEAANR